MKTCKMCGETKYDYMFHKYRGECKICTSRRKKELRAAKKEKVASIIGELKCADCSIEHSNISFFDFHHIDPLDKEENIGRLLGGSSWERIKSELTKCVLLCPNCHRERHLKMENNYGKKHK